MRTLVWLGSTQRDLREARGSVRRTIGGAIRTAQQGGKSDLARAMHGLLGDVMEIRDDDATGTYRLMYTTKLGDRLFILDFFQKKSKNGIATPQADLDRIHLRLKKARETHAAKE
jgi:phage-related protein